jgi:hypothetical protein
MPLRPTITKAVDGSVTIAGLNEDIELDPSVIGLGKPFETVVTVTDGDKKVKYRVVGFNGGNGYLKAHREGK